MRLHNRVIRPGFWTDTELIVNLPITGRMYYMGLVQLAEDSGCLEDDLMAHKIHLFPGDADVTLEAIAEWRARLVKLGKLVPYESRGKQCLFLKNFHKHQDLRKPAAPDLPLPAWVTWTEPYIEIVDGKKVKRNGFYSVSGSYQPDMNLISDSYQREPEPEPEPEIEPEQEPNMSPLPVGSSDKFDSDHPAMLLAEHLRDCILERDPSTKTPKSLQGWALEADRLMRLDKRPFDEAWQLAQWCQQDSFWCSNILSMASFRKQYDKLKRKATQPSRAAPAYQRETAIDRMIREAQGGVAI